MCNQCGLTYALGTAHSCLVALQEQMRALEDRQNAQLSELAQKVELALARKDKQIQEL
jgi:hypothetical protein